MFFCFSKGNDDKIRRHKKGDYLKSSIQKIPNWLYERMVDNPAVKLLDYAKSPIPYTSLIEEALVIATSFQKKPRPILVVKQNLYTAQRLYERIATLLDEKDCALFGADESLRVEAIASSPELTAQKVETLAGLLSNPNQVVITCPSALLRQLPFPEDFKDRCIKVHAGDTLDMHAFKQKLLSGGYQKTSHIDQPLTFAARGGIVDVYSINYDSPIRIEFFDTEVESIRFFDVTTQKTVEKIEEVTIIPAGDVFFTDKQIEEICSKSEELLSKENKPILAAEIESDLHALREKVFSSYMYSYMALLSKTAGIWDYMQNPLIVYSDEQLILDAAKKLNEETVSYIQEMVQEEKMLPKFAMWHDIHSLSKHGKKVVEDPFTENVVNIEELHIPNETLEQKLLLIHQPMPVVLALSEKEVVTVIDKCVEIKLPYHVLSDDEEPVEGINIYTNSFAQGFYLVDENLKVYTAAEIFAYHHHKGRYENKFRNAEVIHGYDELQPGDYVVHAQYGVGQYICIENREIQKVKRDFLKIIYRGNTELLVPLEQFRLVRKFVSREGVVPKLNKLGSGDWEKTKQRLQSNVEDIAERLLTLYANREQHIGFAFSKDNEMTKKFENSFSFDLTPDQEKAVAEIKKDMESNKPMDRLVCGDVGFGKTEVSIRASFKAICDNKQVAVLCPTTILAEQHFHTFQKRYQEFPVTVKVLNRFVSPAEQKQVLKELEEGKVDIIIGTHRLLSKDVKFKDLGLLVVDEEQRFGVEHKEKIKELKNGVDVLSLSATPIPRTLQMSLVGIRSLSLLETPPLNRYSVQTYVVEKDKNLIRDAIQKELSRNGQVFYLHNNIDQIYNIARNIQSLVPESRVGIVHGKLGKEEIEDIMQRFIEKELDILVCTTIVENGIDIPNVNTILVDNAQDFGLAQIYQIKGRVGRSDRLAYAYLLIPPRRQLSEVAQKRLTAVKEFARLGSGYKIAMRDLTIRGAGDLLGSDQSGFIDTVGIDMYIEMLEEAIQAKKDGRKQEDLTPKPKTNIQTTSYIPEEFAPDDFDKLDMYQRIDAIKDEKMLEAYKNDVIDQYGKLPKEVSTLFLKKQLDLALEEPIVENYREIRGQTELTFSPLFSQRADGVKLFEKITKISKDATLRYTNGTIIAILPKNSQNISLAIKIIYAAKESMRNEN